MHDWVDLTWRIQGTLRLLFRKLDGSARRRLLTTIGALVAEDARRGARGKGWKRLGPEIADSVSYRQQGDTGVEVGAAHAAAAMRQFGGRIRAPGKGPGAKKAAWLTIPVKGSPAEGHWAGEMPHFGWRLFRIQGAKGPVLMGTKGKGPGRQTRPMFALRKEVPHPASPWFPSEGQIFRRISEAVRYL